MTGSTPPPMPGGKPATKPPARPPAKLTFGEIPTQHGEKIIIYGTGGIGKTTLALAAPGPVGIIDLDESLPTLRHVIAHRDMKYISGCTTFEEMMAKLAAPGWDEIKSIVIDSGTKCEEMIAEWVIGNVPHEQGNKIERIEDYGWGKGYTHIYEQFLKLLSVLDRHVREGRNIVIVCHECTDKVPNPDGDDYIRYEPRLQSPPAGKASVRLKLKEWADHMGYINYDVSVDKKKKATGSGTRTIYMVQQAGWMAKSRTLADPIPYVQGDDELWNQMFKKEVTS